MKALARRYADRAEFLFVFCRDAHRPPESTGEYLWYGTPARQAVNLAERKQGAELLRASVEPERRLLLDGFGGDSLFERLFHVTGTENPLLILAPDGHIVFLRLWADAAELEWFLEGLTND